MRGEGRARIRLADCILAPEMFIDLTKLSEDELIELNRRVVERLQLVRSARSLTQVAKFTVGMAVEFQTDDGQTVSGTIARLNRRTATVATGSGSWRVSPSLLRVVSDASTASTSHVVRMSPRRRRKRRFGQSAHLIRGFSQMPRTHSFAQAGA